MELGSYFLFLQEQIKDIIIIMQSALAATSAALASRCRRNRGARAASPAASVAASDQFKILETTTPLKVSTVLFQEF
jgi:hypothetical protein